jgi:hypothetical protein
MTRIELMRALIAALALVLASPAYADDDKHERGRHHEKHWRGEDRDDRYERRRWHDEELRGGRYERWREERYHGHRGRGRWSDDYHGVPPGHYRREWGRDVYVYRAPPRYDDWRERDRYALSIGGYFGRDYAVLVSRYYGQPCHWASDWRGDWRRPYWVGRPLPPHLRYHHIDRDLIRRLPPAPYGHSYVGIDRDVLLVADATKLVIDALVLASAR